MKIKFLTPLELKAFGLALGISVGCLVTPFLVPLYMEHLNKKGSPNRKDAPQPRAEQQYTEVHGMN